MYYVVRQCRGHYRYAAQNWVTVSLFDGAGSFRGPAVFDSRKYAEIYMKRYSEMLEQRRNGEISNLKLQIFQEPKIPAVCLPKTRKADSLVAVQEKGFI